MYIFQGFGCSFGQSETLKLWRYAVCGGQCADGTFPECHWTCFDFWGTKTQVRTKRTYLETFHPWFLIILWLWKLGIWSTSDSAASLDSAPGRARLCCWPISWMRLTARWRREFNGQNVSRLIDWLLDSILIFQFINMVFFSVARPKPEEFDSVAHTLALSVMIINDFGRHRMQDYASASTLQQSEGDSGVFLQYIHARLRRFVQLIDRSIDWLIDWLIRLLFYQNKNASVLINEPFSLV